jgi:glucose-6-phosphate 1-dehydrogenase
MKPLDPKSTVRGQYRKYRDEVGVSPTSDVETFVALRVEIDNWRWAGVPFMVRAGKAMATTTNEAIVELQPPPRLLFSEPDSPPPTPNQIRFRLGKKDGVTLRVQAKSPGERMRSRELDLKVEHQEVFGERPEAYERLMGDALDGDARLFARQDAVEQAWRVVQPVLDRPPPVQLYESGSFGPNAQDTLAADVGGWTSIEVVG